MPRFIFLQYMDESKAPSPGSPEMHSQIDAFAKYLEDLKAAHPASLERVLSMRSVTSRLPQEDLGGGSFQERCLPARHCAFAR